VEAVPIHGPDRDADLRQDAGDRGAGKDRDGAGEKGPGVRDAGDLYQRTRLSSAEETQLNVQWREMDDLFREADIVALTPTLTPAAKVSSGVVRGDHGGDRLDSLSALVKNKYGETFSLGLVTCTGAIASVIPPASG